MHRFDGSSILVLDIDRLYGMQLVEVLSSRGARCIFSGSISDAKKLMEQFDFDIVVSNYYLSDGIIHQLIDWCQAHIKFIPLFTALGYPMAGEPELWRKQSIADVFSKNDPNRIMAGISNLLFDFNQFKASLIEMIEPSEVLLEMKVNSERLWARPIEISEDSIFLEINHQFAPGMFGLLNCSLAEKYHFQNLVIPGNFAETAPGGQHFTINRTYHGHWKMFLDLMAEKQTNITSFMKKAAGY